jgi:hypothetical protein
MMQTFPLWAAQSVARCDDAVGEKSAPEFTALRKGIQLSPSLDDEEISGQDNDWPCSERSSDPEKRELSASLAI